MKKIILFVWVIVLLLVPLLEARTGFPDLPASFIPEDAQWVIHVDMKRLRAAEVGKLIEDERVEWITEVNHEMMDEFRIDLVNMTTGITVFGTSRGRGGDVILFSGDFDRKYIISRLEKLTGYKTEKIGKTTIHRFKKSGFCLFLNDRLLMFSSYTGHEDPLNDVRAVLTDKKKNLAATRLMTNINDLPENAFLIAVAEDISRLVDDDDASLLLKKTGLATLAAGEKAGNLTITCKLVTDTPETARNILGIVNGFKALARMKLDDDEKNAWAIVERVNLKLSGNQMELNLEYPSKDLIEQVSHRRIGRKHSH
jgi:hypothetical protein